MKRHNDFEQRKYYGAELNRIGMNYWDSPSGPDKLPYWQEGVVYGFGESEIDQIQSVTQELHNMCLEMVGQVVKSGDYPEYFKLTDLEKILIEQSWKRNAPALYARFDLAYGMDGSLKMFEGNYDTPVSILECSVGQWNYVEQLKTLPDGTPFPDALRTQYNLIDETLQETWKERFMQGTTLHFASSGGFRHEDFGNLVYIMDNALRSGMIVKDIQMEDIGLCVDADGSRKFVDLQDKKINNIFKLYPWEWMTSEAFGEDIARTNTRWMEPAWKMLLSNKSMLIKLWEMFENHPNLLPSFIKEPSRGKWAKKAIHGREGSNIYKSTFADGQHLSTDLAQGSHIVPEYDHWGYMYQQWHDIKPHDGYYPIIGSWVIGDKACGMSIREDKNLVTGMDAFFASHIMIPEDLETQYEKWWK